MTENPFFDKILNESYDDDYKAWKSADNNYKASYSAAKKDIRDIEKSHKWSKDYLTSADYLAHDVNHKSNEMSQWATKNVHSLPSLFGALIKCLLISAPYIVTKLISGAITLSEIPAAIDDQKAKDLIAEIVGKLSKEGLDVEDLHKKMISNYNKENVKFEIGEKIRYDGRVATLVKPMAGDRWQIKYNDGHRETVPKSAIKPYKTELSTRRELYGEDN